MNILCMLSGHKMHVAGVESYKCSRINCNHTESAVEYKGVTIPFALLDVSLSARGCSHLESARIAVRKYRKEEQENRLKICEELLKHATDVLEQFDDTEESKWVQDRTDEYFTQESFNVTPDQPQWTPTDQFDTIGWCWIKYKGEARHAWYNGDDLYKFTRYGHNGWYMTECISGVIAIEEPEL